MEIQIKGARVHNLKDVNASIPKGKMTVITGLSGSGKSSLAFDTLYAEGQRRYVESLSSYARQFLGRLDKPDVDSIDGISPAIAIEQRTSAGGPRSTVGTRTEIHDHLRLLFARIGKTYSPISGEEVKRDQTTDVVNRLLALPIGSRFLLTAPIQARTDRTLARQLEVYSQQGFSRVRIHNEVHVIADLLGNRTDAQDGIEVAQGSAEWHQTELVVDRLAVEQGDSFRARCADSIETALFEGGGSCKAVLVDTDETLEFSTRFERDGLTFTEPTPDFFAFNSPVGACPRCEGFGQILGVDPDLVIPDPRLTLYEGAVAPWRSDQHARWNEKLCIAAPREGISIHTPWQELTDEARDAVWNGNSGFKGIQSFFDHLEAKGYKIQNRVLMSRYRGRTPCTTCKGARIHPDTRHVKINGASLPDLLMKPIADVRAWIEGLQLGEAERTIGARLIEEIRSRMSYISDVGLDYLTLNRPSNTLSGGESQRIALSTCLGSSLVGSTYILDEPSIGLHPHDTSRLIQVLHSLRDLGNTVVVVEHDEDILAAADHVIDMGPLAGTHGGEVVFAGDLRSCAALPADHPSLTAAYLSGRKRIPIPVQSRPRHDALQLIGARANNLKGVDVSIPLHALTVVSGVSGSGKSTLINEVFLPLLRAEIDGLTLPNARGTLRGEIGNIATLEAVDQHPLGKNSRSNPVTYVKAFDDIRSLFASTSMSLARGYKAGHFSFNVPGGRCDQCDGEGEVTIGMQFMADIRLTCDACKGKRYKSEVLEVKWRDKNIAQVLNMTVDDALSFFAHPDPAMKKGQNGLQKIIEKLQPLSDVGLGYLALGQGSHTLSGGEAQRIKLATFLSKGSRKGSTLFIFDEPTTGLHVHDVQKLLEAFDALINQGHTLVVIEHHLDVLAHADHLIDMGPGGGASGGTCTYQGPPSGAIADKSSITGQHLAVKF